MVGEGRPFVLEGEWLYTTRYHHYEEQLATALRERFTQRRRPTDPALLARGLSGLFPHTDALNRQQLGAAMAALRGLTVISGGPGTGKTHTVSRILTILWAQWAVAGNPGIGPRVSLAAPTGKAAARMKESITNGLDDLLKDAHIALPPGRSPDELRTFLTQLQPTTLHRLLGYQPNNPTRFRHNQSDPLAVDIVIVDEASMVDFAMMAKLVDATGADARLVLLGDKFQLASVEAGTVLADIAGPVRANQPTLSVDFAAELSALNLDIGAIATVSTAGPQDGITLLTESRRFGPDSGIGRFAQACLSDTVSSADAVATLSSHDTTRYEHGPNGHLRQPVLDLILEQYSAYLRRVLSGPGPDQSLQQHHSAILADFNTFRVLAAHRRGRLGVEGLNNAIARGLASLHPRFDPTSRHHLGRPVLVRRNDPVVGRYNGDIGILVHAEDGRLVVAFSGEKGIEYLAPARLPDHQTVFAMTIHKSQGSEFDHVLVVLPDADSPILTRELVYTGVTRAKTTLGIVASVAVLQNALNRTVQRASGLRHKLWGSEPLP
jgi:exodeoxyribonuclease V alpha subunit